MSETEIDACITYKFTWHSTAGACRKCSMLNGRTWTDQSIFQATLHDMFHGDIWNLNADHSLAHGRFQHNCRCNLEVTVDIDEAKLSFLLEPSTVKGMMFV